MEVPHRVSAHMIVGFALLAQVLGFAGLWRSLCPGPLKLITCAAVGACAGFMASLIAHVHPAFGMPLFGAWLIGSVAQAGCLIAVLAKPDVSKNQVVSAACLCVSNCMNVWFGVELFKAVG